MNNLDTNQDDIPFDSESDRPAELDELNFEDDKPTSYDEDPGIEIGEDDIDSDPAMPGDDPTDDDLSPETLIREDGSRSPHESGDGKPTDQELTIVDEDEIGVGYGLDEAELARAKPLDGKPWSNEESRESEGSEGQN